MAESNSQLFAIGVIHGAFAAARPRATFLDYHPAYLQSAMYKRGFSWGWQSARAGRAIREWSRPVTGEHRAAWAGRAAAPRRARRGA